MPERSTARETVRPSIARLDVGHQTSEARRRRIRSSARDADTVDDRGARVESSQPVQGVHFAAGRGIAAFGAVDQEGVARRRLAEARGQVRLELDRVCPRKSAHHADREIRAKDFTLVGVVVADGGDAAQ